MTVRTRFAPSPTGYLHIGGARTALFNWLYAKNKGGKFILRIEDTDRERSTNEAVHAILEGMHWLGLEWDEGPVYPCPALTKEAPYPPAKGGHAPYFQTQRLDIYKKYYTELLDKELAYQKDGAIYIKGDPEKKIEDFVIIKSDGHPVYNFAVVIDDVTMEITHVIRGDDHLSNTPRQVLIYKALGLPIPKIIHVPMILGADGERLSKRHGATSVIEFKDMGYLPEAMINYLARLGWACGDQEFFTVDELIKKFTLSGLGKSPSIFDPAKLDWINSEHIKIAAPERLKEFISEKYRATPDINKKIDLVKTRAKTIAGLNKAIAYLTDDTIEYETDAKQELLTAQHTALLKKLSVLLESSISWTAPELEKLVRGFAEQNGVKAGDIIHPLRVALTGTKVSPGIFEVMLLMGKKLCLKRIESSLL